MTKIQTMIHDVLAIFMDALNDKENNDFFFSEEVSGVENLESQKDSFLLVLVKATSRALHIYLKMIRDSENEINGELKSLLDDIIKVCSNLRMTFTMITNTLSEINNFNETSELLDNLLIY